MHRACPLSVLMTLSGHAFLAHRQPVAKHTTRNRKAMAKKAMPVDSCIAVEVSEWRLIGHQTPCQRGGSTKEALGFTLPLFRLIERGMTCPLKSAINVSIGGKADMA